LLQRTEAELKRARAKKARPKKARPIRRRSRKLATVNVDTLSKKRWKEKDQLTNKIIVEGPCVEFKLSRDGLYLHIKPSSISTLLLTIAGIIVLVKQVLIPLF
jgi:hypothetical protein